MAEGRTEVSFNFREVEDPILAALDGGGSRSYYGLLPPSDRAALYIEAVHLQFVRAGKDIPGKDVTCAKVSVFFKEQLSEAEKRDYLSLAGVPGKISAFDGVSPMFQDISGGTCLSTYAYIPAESYPERKAEFHEGVCSLINTYRALVALALEEKGITGQVRFNFFEEAEMTPPNHPVPAGGAPEISGAERQFPPDEKTATVSFEFPKGSPQVRKAISSGKKQTYIGRFAEGAAAGEFIPVFEYTLEAAEVDGLLALEGTVGIGISRDFGTTREIDEGYLPYLEELIDAAAGEEAKNFPARVRSTNAGHFISSEFAFMAGNVEAAEKSLDALLAAYAEFSENLLSEAGIFDGHPVGFLSETSGPPEPELYSIQAIPLNFYLEETLNEAFRLRKPLEISAAPRTFSWDGERARRIGDDDAGLSKTGLVSARISYAPAEDGRYSETIELDFSDPEVAETAFSGNFLDGAFLQASYGSLPFSSPGFSVSVEGRKATVSGRVFGTVQETLRGATGATEEVAKCLSIFAPYSSAPGRIAVLPFSSGQIDDRFVTAQLSKYLEIDGLCGN
ncbi:MAG: hypothetical protein V1820_02100 [archaeon]